MCSVLHFIWQPCSEGSFLSLSTSLSAPHFAVYLLYKAVVVVNLHYLIKTGLKLNLKKCNINQSH